MQRLLGFLVCFLPLATTAALAQGGTPPRDRKPVYDETADARADVDAALVRAAKENKRVLIQWGANWCGWCVKLDHTFRTDRAVAHELLYEYELVHVDVDRFDKNMDLAAAFGADLKASGLPFLTVLAPPAQGVTGEAVPAGPQVLANQETGSLEKDGAHDPAKVLAFLEAHQAEPLTAEQLLIDAGERAQRTGKRVLLTFGAPWCGWCHRFEDWMARPEIAPVLAKAFVIQKIDTDRNVGGEALLTRFRGDAGGGIPWFAFLDGEGRVLATSSGPDGNLGCPWTPEEVAYFLGLVAGVSPALQPADLAVLKRGFVAQREAAERAAAERAEAEHAEAASQDEKDE